MWAATLLSVLVLLCVPTVATAADDGVPLVIGSRNIHVFRAPIGTFTAAERAEGARKRIERAFVKPGEGWTSVRTTTLGIEVRIDDEVLFLVVAGDARATAGETPEDLANQASRVLQKAWGEARERSDPRAQLEGAVKLALATLLLLAALVATLKVSARLRSSLTTSLQRRLEALPAVHWGQRMSASLPGIASRLALLLTWLLVMAMAYSYLTYALAQFALTRPASETMANSIALTPTPRRQRAASSMPRCGCLPSPWPTPTCPARTPRPSRACR
jgi:hypothetical protein